MNRDQAAVVLGATGFRATLTIAIFDLLAASLLAFGALWRSPGFSTAVAALLITGIYLAPLVTVFRRTYTREFLTYFAVMTVVVFLAWATVITFVANKERSTFDALAILLPVTVVVGGAAQILLKRALDSDKTNE